MPARNPAKRLRCLLLATLCALGGAAAMGAQTVTLNANSTAEQALVSVYGALEWTDQRLRQVESFRTDHAYIEPLFDATYTEGNATKRIVIASLTPRPRRESSCHACSPMLGGAVFRQEGAAWLPDSVGQIIELSNSRHASLQLLRIGPQRFGLLHQINDVHGGIETRKASVIFGLAGDLSVRFQAEGFETPGPGACDLPQQHLIVSTVEDATQDREYFDLVADAKWNVATCRTASPGIAAILASNVRQCRRVSRYRFVDGKYQLLSQAVEVCVPLDAGAMPPRD